MIIFPDRCHGISDLQALAGCSTLRTAKPVRLLLVGMDEGGGYVLGVRQFDTPSCCLPTVEASLSQ
jgi:hypothetical protein